MQLALWEEQKPEKSLPDYGETIEYTCAGWADGDTSQAALERLARVLLLPGCRIETFPLPPGQLIDISDSVWFRTILTRVEGTRVIQTLERIKPLVTQAWRLQNTNDETDDC